MLPRRSNNLLRQLGPFFAIIGTSLFALQFAQKAKFEFGPKNSAKLVHSMEELGLKSEESLEEIYKVFLILINFDSIFFPGTLRHRLGQLGKCPWAAQ